MGLGSKSGAYMGVGIALGTAIGVATDNMGLWLPMGLVFGASMTAAQAKKDKSSGADDSASSDNQTND